LGEHAGFNDLFLPLFDGATLRGMLVVGPFAIRRSTGEDIVQRWYEITSSHGKLTEPGFRAYVAATLSTLTLSEAQLGAFRRLTGCLASLLVSGGSEHALTSELEAARRILPVARYPEKMSDLVREMLDQQGTIAWDAYALSSFGLRKVPAHAVVGLLRARQRERDPLDEELAQDHLWRAAARLCAANKGLICARLGTSGLVFLVDHAGPKSQLSAKLVELATRVRALAKKHGFELFAGVSQPNSSAPLRAQYESASWAAQKALSLGQAIVHGEPQRAPTTSALVGQRAELGESISGEPRLLMPRFDRYVEAVLSHTGYRLEPTLTQLEAAVDRMSEPLLSSGFMDEKGYRELSRSMREAKEHSATVREACAAYRGLVAALVESLNQPVYARQVQSSERALAFIRENLHARLSVAQVARLSGYSADHLSDLLKREQGLPFASLVKKLRVEHALRMLKDTRLSVEEIQNLSGFHNRTYFHRAFKEITGVTPAYCRRHTVTSEAAKNVAHSRYSP
jgi:AraC-like DNA-binding protein